MKELHPLHRYQILDSTCQRHFLLTIQLLRKLNLWPRYTCCLFDL